MKTKRTEPVMPAFASSGAASRAHALAAYGIPRKSLAAGASLPQGVHNRQQVCSALPAALQAHKALRLPSAAEPDYPLVAISCVSRPLARVVQPDSSTAQPTGLGPCTHVISANSLLDCSADLPSCRERTLKHKTGLTKHWRHRHAGCPSAG